MKTIGLDVGNGSVGFAVSGKGSEMTTSTYPSVYASYAPSESVRIANVHDHQPTIFLFDKREYVLGYEDVLNSGDVPISAYDRDERIHRREFQTLTKLALLDAATKDGAAGVIEVKLQLGVPVEDYRKEKVDLIKKWFTEPIVGAKNGEQVVVMVKDIDVISQPTAVLMDQYLDDEGFVSDERLEHARVLVVDSGSGTLDMTEFDHMRITQQFSEPIGINDVYARIMQGIQQLSPKTRVHVYDLEHQLRSQDTKSEITYTFGRFTVPVTELRDRAMNEIWERLIGSITSRFPDRLRFDRIFVAGGTADAFRTYFQSWDAAAKLVPEPQLAVARGLYKYAVVQVATVE
ncbi:MAG: ParM/StbA family protein [Bacilli bacterium]